MFRLLRVSVTGILQFAVAHTSWLALVRIVSTFGSHLSLVEHAVPRCKTVENYKGILDGHARGVFAGRIRVMPGAQKTSVARGASARAETASAAAAAATIRLGTAVLTCRELSASTTRERGPRGTDGGCLPVGYG